MKKLFSQIVSASAGLWLATLYVPGVVIKAYANSSFFGFALKYQWEIILVLGITLGLLNFFLKPLLHILSLPLQVITLGLSTILINMVFIWILDIMFEELSVPIIYPLLYTTLIIWGINIILNFFITKHT